MKDLWDFSESLLDSLEKLVESLKEWNKSIYSHIISQKKNLMHKFTTIRKQMHFSSSNHLAPLEMEIRQDLEKILHHEEIL